MFDMRSDKFYDLIMNCRRGHCKVGALVDGRLGCRGTLLALYSKLNSPVGLRSTGARRAKSPPLLFVGVAR
jgi:hypothetical protein